LVKKKLGKDCVPLWLESCSDDDLLEAAAHCSTYFETCRQFAKQEQRYREQCGKMINEIYALQGKTAAICREEDAAVRHAFAQDWEKSNMFRSVNLLREELGVKQTDFDAALDDMIRKQNELLKQVQQVCGCVLLPVTCRAAPVETCLPLTLFASGQAAFPAASQLAGAQPQPDTRRAFCSSRSVLQKGYFVVRGAEFGASRAGRGHSQCDGDN
jgi:hypothetical protein